MRNSLTHLLRAAHSVRGRLGSQGFITSAVLTASALIMETLAVYPWVLWFSTWDLLGWTGPPLTFLLSIGLMGLAYGATRYALSQRWNVSTARVAILVSAVLALALAVRLQHGAGYLLWDMHWLEYVSAHTSVIIGALVFGVYVVWRGIVLGRETLAFDGLYRTFLIGLSGLVCLMVLWRIFGGRVFAGAPPVAGAYIAGYFLAALVALALSNFLAVQEEIKRRQEIPDYLARRWLTLLVGAALAIVLMGIGLASIVSFDLIAFLTQPLGVLADGLLLVVLYAIGFPLGIAVALLEFVLRFLVSLLRGSRTPEPFQPPDFSDMRRLTEGQQPRSLPPELLLLAKWGLVAALSALVLYLLARAVFRYWSRREEEGIEEINESLWTWENFRNDVKGLLRAFLARFQRKDNGGGSRRGPHAASNLAEDQQDLDVREIYRRLLWVGEQAGIARAREETPYEYHVRMSQAIPVENDALKSVTEAYVRLRYGHQPPGPEALVNLNSMWRRLRGAIQRLGKDDEPS